jgi:hypothetical protein
MIPTSRSCSTHKFEASEDSIFFSLLLPVSILLEAFPSRSTAVQAAAPPSSVLQESITVSRDLNFIISRVTRHNAAEIVPGINLYHHGKNETEETETAWKEVEEVSSFSNDASLEDASGGYHAQYSARLFGPKLRCYIHDGGGVFECLSFTSLLLQRPWNAT